MEDEVDAYLEHGTDRATARALDVEKMVETADSAAYATESPEATIKIIRQFLTPGEPWEATLRRVAREDTPVTVEFARGLLAKYLEPLREPLRPWSEGRTGRGIGSPDDGGVFLDIRGYYFDEPPTGRGRPRDHDPALVRMALLRADAIQRRLGVRSLIGLAGGLPEPIRASEVGVALYFAAAIHPNAPTLFQAIVLAGRLFAGKRRPSARQLSRAAAAQMAGLPVDALTALEKATAG